MAGIIKSELMKQISPLICGRGSYRSSAAYCADKPPDINIDSYLKSYRSRGYLDWLPGVDKSIEVLFCAAYSKAYTETNHFCADTQSDARKKLRAAIDGRDEKGAPVQNLEYSDVHELITDGVSADLRSRMGDDTFRAKARLISTGLSELAALRAAKKPNDAKINAQIEEKKVALRNAIAQTCLVTSNPAELQQLSDDCAEVAKEYTGIKGRLHIVAVALGGAAITALTAVWVYFKTRLKKGELSKTLDAAHESREESRKARLGFGSRAARWLEAWVKDPAPKTDQAPAATDPGKAADTPPLTKATGAIGMLADTLEAALASDSRIAAKPPAADDLASMQFLLERAQTASDALGDGARSDDDKMRLAKDYLNSGELRMTYSLLAQRYMRQAQDMWLPAMARGVALSASRTPSSAILGIISGESDARNRLNELGERMNAAISAIADPSPQQAWREMLAPQLGLISVAGKSRTGLENVIPAELENIEGLFAKDYLESMRTPDFNPFRDVASIIKLAVITQSAGLKDTKVVLQLPKQLPISEEKGFDLYLAMGILMSNMLRYSKAHLIRIDYFDGTLSAADNGIGYQVEVPTDPQKLAARGLVVLRDLVKKNVWEMNNSSDFNKGTTVTIRLSPANSGPAPQGPKGGGEKSAVPKPASTGSNGAGAPADADKAKVIVAGVSPIGQHRTGKSVKGAPQGISRHGAAWLARHRSHAQPENEGFLQSAETFTGTAAGAAIPAPLPVPF
ncbi:MAG: hypothetical protein V2A66_01120 [Pseudomonadota bacterium]